MTCPEKLPLIKLPAAFISTLSNKKKVQLVRSGIPFELLLNVQRRPKLGFTQAVTSKASVWWRRVEVSLGRFPFLWREGQSNSNRRPLQLGHCKHTGWLDRRPLDTLSYMASSGYDLRMTSTAQWWLTAALSPTRHKFTTKVFRFMGV